MKSEIIAHHRKIDQKSQSLWEHLSQASELAGRFAKKIDLEDAGKLVGLVHDLGKASQEFQSYLKTNAGLLSPDQDGYMDNAAAMRGEIDHSTAGAQLIYEYLNQRSKEDQIAAEFLALCVASHHSGLIDCIKPDGEDGFTKRITKADHKTHKTEALGNLEPDEFGQINILLTKEIGKQIVKKIHQLREPDIDSKGTYAFKMGLLARFLFSGLIDADRLSTSDFENPGNLDVRNYGEYQPWHTLIERLDQAVVGLESSQSQGPVNKLRHEVSQACLAAAARPRGIFQLTVPTGGGKTLASLRFALNHAKTWQMERIFYVIPYTSIIDQNAQKIRDILEDRDSRGRFLDKVVLEHHSNLTPEEESYRHNLLAENWDAPVILTTLVQFLEALFGDGTRSVRRMHQLANAIIIFDEIQTLPVSCVHMFNVAIRFLKQCCGASIVLCTATQPLLDKIDSLHHALRTPPENKIIADERDLFDRLERYTVFDRRKEGGWNDDGVANLIEEELHTYGSVLTIVNTKKSARSLYQAVCSRDFVKCYHLSTNMCPAHRLDVLNIIKKKLNKESVVCISTQLIEAGVDIDFGTVIRYLAGLDSIVQAAGRCNRNGDRPSGNVIIVNPHEERIDKLPDLKKGKEVAERILREYQKNPETFDHNLLGLEVMERYFRYYFYQRKDEMGYCVGPNSPVGREDTLFNVLSMNVKSVDEYFRKTGLQPAPRLLQSFQAGAKAFRVIDAPTRGVVVPYRVKGKQIINGLCSAYDIHEQRRLLKQAQRYSVNLLPNEMKKMLEIGAIYEAQKDMGVYCMAEEYYDGQFGWSDQIVNNPGLLLI